MSAEDEHVAHPHLYGAPAYARPPLSITPTALPLHPDDLPIAAEQTPEEQAVAERPIVIDPEPELRPQPLLLSVLAGRILRRAS
jgi:hypothetical protein